MLGIETKLSTVFHPQMDRQMEQMNQELEQYLRFFMDHRQKDWPEQLASAEFVVNNKVHTATKVLPFIANYGRELRMGGDIRKRGKIEKATEFVKRMKKVHEEAEAVSESQEVDLVSFAFLFLFLFLFSLYLFSLCSIFSTQGQSQ